jgi:hypothetical protein
MTEGDYMNGDREVGSFFECENLKCPHMKRKGYAYREDYDESEAEDVAAEMAWEARMEK